MTPLAFPSPAKAKSSVAEIGHPDSAYPFIMSYTIQQLAKELHLSENSASKILALYIRARRLSPDRGPRKTTIITETMYSEIVDTYLTAKRVGLSFLQFLTLKLDHREIVLTSFAEHPFTSSQTEAPIAPLQELRVAIQSLDMHLQQFTAQSNHDSELIKRNQEGILHAIGKRSTSVPLATPAPVPQE